MIISFPTPSAWVLQIINLKYTSHHRMFKIKSKKKLNFTSFDELTNGKGAAMLCGVGPCLEHFVLKCFGVWPNFSRCTLVAII